MNIGFIGLGIMGRPMADNLQQAGHSLFLHRHRGAPPSEMLERGAMTCSSWREVAEASDVVILMLPDTPEVEAVLFGSDGVAEGLSANKTVVDMSTISPLATRDFARRIGSIGCDYLDAPVSGGEIGARDGTLTIMVGGPEEAFERVRPLFETMGRNVTLIGTANGDGQTCKAANQIVVALTIAAVAEALVFASKAGADAGNVRKALLGGFASSRILEVHGERMLQKAFEPGFRIELHHKDLEIALDNARQIGAGLPATALCQQMLNACMSRGDGALDHSALVKVIETLAAHDL